MLSSLHRFNLETAGVFAYAERINRRGKFTSREFARNLKSVKRAANKGTVTLTARGLPAEYTGGERQQNLLEAMQGLPNTQGSRPRLELKLKAPQALPDTPITAPARRQSAPAHAHAHALQTLDQIGMCRSPLLVLGGHGHLKPL